MTISIPRLLAVAALSALFVAPVFSFAQSSSDIQKEIDALIAQLETLQKKLNELNTTGTTFTAEPSSGVAPLKVTAKAKVTAAGNYAIEWGDNTASLFLRLQEGLCSDGTTFGACGLSIDAANHTYASAGTYAAKLLSGVSGATTTIATRTITVTTSTGGLSVSPTVGSAPLAVTITAVPTAVLEKIEHCSLSVGPNGPSGNGLTVEWGDSETKYPVYVEAHKGDGCRDQVKNHTYTTAGTYTVKVTSWHPGSTNAPVTDWEGTATVSVGQGGSSCQAPDRDLQLGDTDANKGNQVSVLQRFLARDMNIYPDPQISGFYGKLTESAVRRYQKAKGILQTGFVGPLTRKAINTQCAGGTPESPYAFTATPTSGTAPVLVSFVASSTDILEPDMWYAIDFGDGERGNAATSTAIGKLTASHTYTKGGSFKANLVRDEDLCGNWGVYSYGCTRELIVDSVAVTIAGGSGGGGGGGGGGGDSCNPTPAYMQGNETRADSGVPKQGTISGSISGTACTPTAGSCALPNGAYAKDQQVVHYGDWKVVVQSNSFTQKQYSPTELYYCTNGNLMLLNDMYAYWGDARYVRPNVIDQPNDGRLN